MSDDLIPTGFINEEVMKPTAELAQEGKFGMTIVHERPPVWENVLLHFKINVDSTLFTYADKIYNPARIWIPEDYLFHESIHAGQQGHTEEGAAKWWARYFQDQYFRIDQEAEAYGKQYQYWCRTNKDRNWRNKKLIELSKTLASPMYGSVVNESGARNLILQKSK